MSFNEIKGRFGFGCMRLPMIGDDIDIDQFKKMVDMFMEAGLNYFDTSYMYHHQKSETALKEALTSRYPRESYVFADKLSKIMFEKHEDILPMFEYQLEATGAGYFDFYLLHAVNKDIYKAHVECDSFSILRKLKDEGKIKHIAMSFHDTVDVLRMILDEQPDIEMVQLQFNYLDYDSDKVQSRLCYEECVKRGIKVTVMEPVKGGKLMSLPPEAKAVIDEMGNASPASYCIRFCLDHPGIMMVLSGMSDISQMEDNLNTYKQYTPLTKEELDNLHRIVKIVDAINPIDCTGCAYCMEACPQQIPIPNIFRYYNEEAKFSTGKRPIRSHREAVAKANGCLDCGACEAICPQHLSIRELFKECLKAFE